MKKNLLTALGMSILMIGTITVNGQQKDKKTDQLGEYDQIIIKWKGDKGEKGDKGTKGSKGDKDIKLTIEIKDDNVVVNGKPLSEFNNDELAILKKDMMVLDGNTLRLATPRTPRSAFQGNAWSWSDDGYGYTTSSNKAFLGVGSEKTDKGVVITEITKGSPAEKAGLKEGDIITKLDETSINSPDLLSKTVGKYKPEDKVVVTYKRADKEMKTTAILGKRKSAEVYGFGPFNEEFNMNWGGGQPKLGIKAQDTDEGKGVKVLDVDDESAAEKAGLKEADIITHFDGTEINSVNELVDVSKAVRDAKKTKIIVKYLRDNKEKTTEIKIPRKLRTAEL